jgi:DNA uptake protein ComE-like DNA-binding protein
MLYNEGNGINKLNLNEMKYEELSSHPYIGYSKARLLIAFRNTHGQIKNRDELMRAALFDSTVVEKILPYCLF